MPSRIKKDKDKHGLFYVIRKYGLTQVLDKLYPDFPLWFSAIALIISIIVPLLR